ncbi:hypothetical protein ACPA9J_03610 [Pseudomonas aeruginosa]
MLRGFLSRAIWPTCSPTRTSWSIAHPRKSPRSTRGRRRCRCEVHLPWRRVPRVDRSFVRRAGELREPAIGRTSTRVVSCNTTSIVCTLGALRTAGLLKRARGTLIRRASDPWEAHAEGIINTLVPEKTIPSHQGPDARAVIPDLDVVTIAVKAPHNSSHLRTWWVELTRPASARRGAGCLALRHGSRSCDPRMVSWPSTARWN